MLILKYLNCTKNAEFINIDEIKIKIKDEFQNFHLSIKELNSKLAKYFALSPFILPNSFLFINFRFPA